MKLKFVALLLLLSFLAVSIFGLVNASVTVSSDTYFYYDNGTSFTHPGTYENITRIDNVWYFDNVEYSPSSGDLITPSPTPNIRLQNSINSVFTNMYIALGLIGVSLIVLACFIIMSSMKDAESNPLPGFIILLGTIIGLVVAFLIISGFQKSLNIDFSILFIHKFNILNLL